MDTHSIGETSGAVWRFLRDNGECALGAIEGGVDAPKAQVHMAIGWLAREGKVDSRRDKRSTVFFLIGE